MINYAATHSELCMSGPAVETSSFCYAPLQFLPLSPHITASGTSRDGMRNAQRFFLPQGPCIYSCCLENTLPTPGLVSAQRNHHSFPRRGPIPVLNVLTPHWTSPWTAYHSCNLIFVSINKEWAVRRLGAYFCLHSSISPEPAWDLLRRRQWLHSCGRNGSELSWQVHEPQKQGG